VTQWIELSSKKNANGFMSRLLHPQSGAAQHGMKPTPLRGGCIGSRFGFAGWFV
jgi:hypothetical protein